MHIFSVICIGNPGFSREQGHIFRLPEGIWKYTREFEIFKFTRVFPNSRRQQKYMSIFTRKTRICYIFYSSFPVLCNTKHFLLAYMSIFPRKTPISYIFFSSFPVLCNTKHFLLTMPRRNIPIARNIVDQLIKPNTAKPMKTLQLDANFWLPQKKVIS